MSEIEMKIKAETEDFAKICEKLTDKLMSHLNDGIDQADTEEVGAVIDMIKDMCDAKEKCVKSMYYTQILEAMKDSEYGEDYDEDGPKFYRGRSATTGRYVHRPYTKMMDDRDMDRDHGKMYYTEYTGNMPATVPYPMAKGYEDGYIAGMTNGSKYENHKKGYEESKDLEGKVKNLDSMLGDIEDDLSKIMPGMGNQEKTLLKNRLQNLQNKVV